MNQKDFDKIVDDLVYHHAYRSGAKTTVLKKELSLDDETIIVGDENDIELSILDFEQGRASLPLRKVKKSDLNKDQLLIKSMKVDKVSVKALCFSWARLVEEFDKRYENVFGNESAKAHLGTKYFLPYSTNYPFIYLLIYSFIYSLAIKMLVLVLLMVQKIGGSM